MSVQWFLFVYLALEVEMSQKNVFEYMCVPVCVCV